MLATKMFRDHARGLPDLLNWAALVDDGVVLGKDGVLLAGYFYRGPDLDSATDEERNHLTARVNAALARFGSGWATWSDAVRLPAAGYPAPDRSHFPDLVTWLVDAERRRQFTREGAHYESEYALILAYTPPLRRTSKLAELIYDDDAAAASSPADRLVAQFRRALEEFEDQLGDALRLRRMRGYTVRDARGRDRLYDELVNYFAFCLTGELAPVAIPAAPMYLDAYLGAPEFWPGDTPRVGEHYIACVAIDGFPGESSRLTSSTPSTSSRSRTAGRRACCTSTSTRRSATWRSSAATGSRRRAGSGRRCSAPRAAWSTRTRSS